LYSFNNNHVTQRMRAATIFFAVRGAGQKKHMPKKRKYTQASHSNINDEITYSVASFVNN
jgi:hypothetical protein